jgi:prepilin-type processing-associated H-X9-DG protein/prepilin-type N-terminal cleavage/methylation domain-containing protein
VTGLVVLLSLRCHYVRKERLTTCARTPTPRGGLSAFTLIELLVVIAVIAVLASLLLPGLSHAKGQAKSIKCRSNLRQLGIQLALYVSDFNAYPSLRYTHTNLLGTPTGVRVSGEASIHGNEEQGVKRCPTRLYAPITEGLGILYFSGATSYGYNHSGYLAKGRDPNPSLGLSETAREDGVRVPSDMIALGDNLVLVSGTVAEFGGLLRDDRVIAYNPPDDRVKKASARHRNQGNVSFCDGHVEAVKFKRLFFDRDDASLRRWNRDNEPHR